MNITRQLHVRLLLLRPVLSQLINTDCQSTEEHALEGSNSLTHRTFLQCAIVCVKAAQEAIDLICKEKSKHVGEVGNLDAWWYNVLFLYTSATVLIAARLSRAILAEVTEDSILAAWRNAVEVLEEYGTFNTSIRLLIATLNLLFDAVPWQYSRLRKQPAHVEADSAPILWHQLAVGIQSPARSQMHPATSVPSPGFQAARDFAWDQNLTPTGFDCDIGFDPNDLSWLTAVPLHS